DFTVNAMSYDIADFSIIDYLGGKADLESAVIRTIGDPRVRFTEDPVRMLRAVRFAAQLGFRIDGDTWEAMVELAPAIARATPPRLYEEVLKLFLCGEGEAAYQLLRRSGLFAHLFPEYDRWLARESGGFPHVGASRALERVDETVRKKSPPSPGLLLAMVFGDYLEEKGAELKAQGLPPQQGVDQAVAEFVQATAPVVLIPNRAALVLRDILYAPNRFRKIPGRRAESFTQRPSFREALEYFRFTTEQTGGSMRQVQWWEQLAAGAPVEAPEAAAEGAPKRRRRRRRKPRPTGEA
ncbi:MAG TPA: poly(A) polymerase, partial [Verrucomicrobiae bacterium]|nr:poly(A) polymerase [Verrucomicrobiae bacterium]